MSHLSLILAVFEKRSETVGQLKIVEPSLWLELSLFYYISFSLFYQFTISDKNGYLGKIIDSNQVNNQNSYCNVTILVKMRAQPSSGDLPFLIYSAFLKIGHFQPFLLKLPILDMIITSNQVNNENSYWNVTILVKMWG